MIEAARGFLESLAARGASQYTIKNREESIRLFARWLTSRGRPTHIEDIERSDFAKWIGELIRTRARGTAICRYDSIVVLFKWARSSAVCENNPTSGVERPKSLKALPRYVPEEVLAAFMDHLRGRDARTHRRDLAIVELLYSSGLRIGEICALNMSDLSMTQGIVIVRRGKGGKDRVTFSCGAEGSLRRYLSVRSQFIKPATSREDLDALFLSIRGRRMTARATLEVIADLSERIRLPRITPHMIRGSFATHLVDHGCDIRTVQELLGHESLTTTQRYCAVSISHMRAEFERTHPLMRQKDRSR